MKKIRSLSGMLDLFNDSDASNSAEHIFRVEKKLKNIFNTYNYNEIRTPALEETDLFKRSVGDVSDIVNKEIYTFLDRNGKSISLRPEGGVPQMFAVSDADGWLDMDPITEEGDMGTRDQLRTGDVMIINTGTHVWCWVGNGNFLYFLFN